MSIFGCLMKTETTFTNHLDSPLDGIYFMEGIYPMATRPLHWQMYATSKVRGCCIMSCHQLIPPSLELVSWPVMLNITELSAYSGPWQLMYVC